MFVPLRRARGFSVYELMVVVAIIAITLGWAFPSFLDAMRNNRMASRSNELVTAINLTRMEAIRRGSDMVICASTDGLACGGNWNDGWIIWADADGERDIDDTDNTDGEGDIIRVAPALEYTTATAATGMRQIAFNSRGIATGLPVATADRQIALQPDACPTGQHLMRTLRISTTGQIGLGHGVCP